MFLELCKLIGYNITIETAGPGAVSCNHSSYYPGKKGVKKLICQQLQGHATATNSVLVCVSTNRSTNISWNDCEDGICKIAREDAMPEKPSRVHFVEGLFQINCLIKQRCLCHLF